jgi:hypothetical protein
MAGSWALWMALGLVVVREVAGAVIQHVSQRALERLTRQAWLGCGRARRMRDGAARSVGVDDPTNRTRTEPPIDPIRLPR